MSHMSAAPSNQVPGTVSACWLEATRKNTAKPRKSPKVLSLSSFSGAQPPHGEPVRVTLSPVTPTGTLLRANVGWKISLLMISGNLGVTKWDLEEISTSFQHCPGRVLLGKDKSLSCYPACCTEREKGKRKAVCT